MQYTYNKNTRILHIKGYCTNSHSPDNLTFTSEGKAYAYGGQGVRMCKWCQKKRDAQLEQINSKNK